MPLKKNLLAFLLVLHIVTSGECRASDSLIYRSAFEGRLIQLATEKKSPDFLALFLAINADSATCGRYSSSLNQFFAHLDPKVAASTDHKRRAKIIFKEVHGWFLKRYEENVFLDQVFADGTYNCLTASMLYSLVLDKYNIPYAIKEKPTHIYLVVYPGTANILFETTNPKGLYVPDEKFKRAYVSGLVSMKLVSEDHVKSVGIANAFNEYYYDKENISREEMAGLQYFNQAVLFHESDDINAAVLSAVKATMLYPSTRNNFFKLSLIEAVIANSNFQSLRDITYLAEFANSTSDVQGRKYVIGVFGNILTAKLIEQDDENFAAKTYEILRSGIADDSLRNQVTYQYELAMTNFSAMKGDMDAALVHAEKVHAINPNDVRIHELVVRSLVLKSERSKGKNHAIETLVDYEKRFPFLTENKTFRALVIYQYAFRAYNVFLQNDEKEGTICLKRIEDELSGMDGSPLMVDELIGLAYAEAGACYFRKRDLAAAKTILKKGLEIVPEHGELTERLRIVEEEEERVRR